MAEAFGTEQDVSVGPLPGPSPVNRPVRGSPVSNIAAAVSGPLSTLARVGADISKQRADKDLGNFIADANESIAQKTNPIERQREHDRLFNLGTSKFGSSAVKTLNSGLKLRALEQSFNPISGAIENVDTATGAVVSSDQLIADDETEIQKFVIGEFAQFSGNMPQSAEAAGLVLETAAAGGTETSRFHLNRSATLANNAVMNMDRELMNLQVMSRDSRITASTRDQFVQQTRARVVGDMLVSLQSMSSSGFQDILSDTANGVTPDMVMGVVNGMVSDFVIELNDNNAFQLLGLDSNELLTQMNGISDNIREVYQAAFEQDNTRLGRKDTELKMRVELLKNEEMLNIANTNPVLFNNVVAAEGITALANSINTFQAVTATMEAGLGSVSTNTLGRSALQAVEGPDFPKRNAQRLDRLILRNDPTRIDDAFNITRETLRHPTGHLYIEQMQKWWTDHKSELNDLMGETEATRLIGELNQLGVQIQDQRDAIGLTSQDVENDRSWFEALGASIRSTLGATRDAVLGAAPPRPTDQDAREQVQRQIEAARERDLLSGRE